MRYSAFAPKFFNTPVYIFIFVNSSRPFDSDGKVSLIPSVYLSLSFHSPVFFCHPFYLSSSSSFVLLYPTNGAFGFFKSDRNWFFIIYRIRLLDYGGKTSYLWYILARV